MVLFMKLIVLLLKLYVYIYISIVVKEDWKMNNTYNQR